MEPISPELIRSNLVQSKSHGVKAVAFFFNPSTRIQFQSVQMIRFRSDFIPHEQRIQRP